MNRLIFLFFVISLISCDKNSIVEKFKNEINLDDIDCLEQINKVENDLKKGVDVYCKSSGMLIDFSKERHSTEFDSILESKNIQIKNAHYSDIVYENKRQNCYCELMNIIFEEKYGTKYIDSIHLVSDSLWILKNPDLIFSKGGINGLWNKPALFPGDKFYDSEYHTGLQEQFDELFDKYDRNYIVTNKENGNGIANIRIDVFVDRLGNATINNYHITYFDLKAKKENYNESYHGSIKNLAFKLIKENKWKPATVGNMFVNSEFSVIINLK